MSKNLANGKLDNAEKTELFSLIARGDTPAFARAHALYKSRLLYYAISLTRDENAAQDILSEAFLALWKARKKIRSELHLQNFLYLAVRHRALNWLGSKKRHLGTLEELAETEMETEWPDPQTVQAEMIHMLRQAVQALPPDYRRIFELSYDRELNPGEIAQILRSNPSTVRTQKKRAIDLIRIWIQEHRELLLLFIF